MKNMISIPLALTILAVSIQSRRSPGQRYGAGPQGVLAAA